jgi:tRNA threonylcarbamoyladenosine biosynthesis protein TsaB
MVVLALDTTTPAGSCAIVTDQVVVREEASDVSLPPATRLPQDLMTLLEHTGMPLGQVDVFAVATGPGSFTGLRIGIATMQGLAFAAGKPLIGISALDALAEIAAVEAAGQQIATWVDAWRGEVYAALYVDGREIATPVVSSPEAVLTAIGDTPTLFIGDGARTYVQKIQGAMGTAGRLSAAPTPVLAGMIGLLASRLAERGEPSPPHAIRPLYVRRTDAELAREARVAG